MTSTVFCVITVLQFWRNILPASLGLKRRPSRSRWQAEFWLLPGFLLGLLFNCEEGGDALKHQAISKLHDVTTQKLYSSVHLQLVPRPRIGGPIHPLPHMTSWQSAQLVKHRDSFTFIFYILSSLFTTITFSLLGLLVFGLRSSSTILKNATFSKLGVVPSSNEGVGDTYSVWSVRES
jgi:hypothetical protein